MVFTRFRPSVIWVIYQLVAWIHLANTQTQEPSSERHIRAPSSSLVKPKSVLPEYTLGHVVNPKDLISGETPTLFRYRGSSTSIPTLDVDFGQNAVGMPVIEFADTAKVSSSGGFPGLRFYFSESLEFLGDRSDFTRADNAEGPPSKVPSGTDRIAVESAP
ncbi:hypothetical protein DL771_004669 [Monosporascus sp. 5C6A]|nr:hypothetical protein DL771_004669 [Monosporascus sp. 5C6A]